MLDAAVDLSTAPTEFLALQNSPAIVAAPGGGNTARKITDLHISRVLSGARDFNVLAFLVPVLVEIM